MFQTQHIQNKIVLLLTIRDMDHVCRSTKYWLPWLVGMPAETTTAIVSLMMGNVLTQFPKLKLALHFHKL